MNQFFDMLLALVPVVMILAFMLLPVYLVIRYSKKPKDNEEDEGDN